MTNDKSTTSSQALYRWGTRFISFLPPWLLRLRPFGVYQISVREAELSVKEASASELATKVRWISSAEEAALLAEVATSKNIASWNGDTIRAVAAWQGDKAVGVAWIAAESFDEAELGLRFQLEADEVWLFASVVAPSFRRQGIYQQMLRHLIAELRQTQVNRILLGVSVGNQPSLQAHSRQGAVQLGSIYAAKSLGLVLCRCGGTVRRLSLSPITCCRPIRLAVD